MICAGTAKVLDTIENNQFHSQFQAAVLNHEHHRQQAGLKSLRQAHMEEKKKLEQSAPVEWAGLNFADPFQCARGFAYGLQFNPNKMGPCYIALDASLSAASNLESLLLQAYNPTVWANIAGIYQSQISYISAINSACDFQKLIKSVTTNPATAVSALIGRIGGGFIAEIPSTYLNMKNAQTCFDFSTYAGNLFSLLADYYI